MNVKTLAMALLLLFTSISCVGGEADRSVDAPARLGTDISDPTSLRGRDSRSVYNEMTSLTENKHCESNSDCNAMPTGELPCGGPSSYMVYSKLIGDEAIAQMVRLTERHKELARIINQKNQMMGACQVLPAVRTACVDNQCVGSSVTGSNLGGLTINRKDGQVE